MFPLCLLTPGRQSYVDCRRTWRVSGLGDTQIYEVAPPAEVTPDGRIVGRGDGPAGSGGSDDDQGAGGAGDDAERDCPSAGRDGGSGSASPPAHGGWGADGRSLQPQRAESQAEAIEHWRSQQGEGGVNLAALHGWLRREHGYEGSLRSVQRYWRRAYPAPAVRARRRVETPAGAQAQVDWAHFPGVLVGGEAVDLVALHMVLSWSRREAIVWSRSRDALAWQSCHTGCFARLGGVPAAVRVDNERTAVVRGAGAWGTINPAYRRYATVLRFHVDACAPRQPQAKGKVERRVRDQRRAIDPAGRSFARPRGAAGLDGRATGGAGARAALPGERDERGGGLGAGAGAADTAAGAAARAV